VLIGIVVRVQENTKKQRRWIYWKNIHFAERHTNDHDYTPHSTIHFLTSSVKTFNSYYYYSRHTCFESRLGADSLDFRDFLISFQKSLVLVKRVSFLPFSSTPHLWRDVPVDARRRMR